jgi:glycosyltransferase involved in cell wall biosynthesis
MVGGLERYAADLYRALSERIEVELLANRVGLRGVPTFAIRVIWQLLWYRRRYRRVHFADAALAPVAWLARAITDVPVTISTHALDVIYPNALYQWIVPWCLRRLDGVVSVSRYTRDACTARGVEPDRCRVIPNGIRVDASVGESRGDGEEAFLPEGLDGKRVLVTIGRLVRRKGVAWFVSEVMPRLGEEFVCLVGGAGEQGRAIEQAIATNGLQRRVFMLGTLDEHHKRALLERADLFLMPNIPIDGDAEGFGISAIEASSRGVPVIAANIEGLRDAVIDGVTGRLVATQDGDAWIEAVSTARFDRTEVARETLLRFDWDRLVEEYLEFFGIVPERGVGA